jgi:AraC-like DNA-binding protein
MIDMLEFLDNIFRYGAVALFLWIGGILLYNACGRIQARIGAYAAFSTALYLIYSDQSFWQVFGEYAKFLVPFGVLTTGLIWLFCVSLFDDDLKLRPVHYLVPSAFFISGIPFVLGLSEHPSLGDGVVHKLIAVGKIFVIGHVIFVAWKGRDIDLIERRRKFRLLFVSIVVVISLIILLVEAAFSAHEIGAELKLLQAIAFLIVSVGILSRISLIEAEALFMPSPKILKAPVRSPPELCRPEDENNLAVLTKLMADEIYKEPGLTTAMLAEKARMPEHRMRHLINKHMGYRNFADYLNYHRVEDAKRRLSDIDERHIPVLTIAMETGYLSLGPFNRAFKERTGLTPTAYRKNSLLDMPLRAEGGDKAIYVK